MRLPSGVSKWIAAHPSGAEGFEVVGLRSFTQSQGTATETLRDLWFAYLVRTLGNELKEGERAGLDTHLHAGQWLALLLLAATVSVVVCLALTHTAGSVLIVQAEHGLKSRCGL